MTASRKSSDNIPLDTLNESSGFDLVDSGVNSSRALLGGSLPSSEAFHRSRMYFKLLAKGKESRERNQKTTTIPTNIIFHHRDFLGRPFKGKRDDRFLNPKNGRPSKLRLQCSKKVFSGDSEATWIRTKVSDNGPWLFRLAQWSMEGQAALKFVPACLALAILLLNPLPVTVTQGDNFFEPLPYKDWQYAYASQNALENPPARQHHERMPQPEDVKSISYRPLPGQIERLVEPDILYLADGMKRIMVSQWRQKHGKDAKMRYVFVSYTSQQFATEADMYYLHQVGQHAAQTAGIEAYWVSCSCLGTSPSQRSENVWRICDIVRGSFAVVVAVARQRSEQQQLPLTEWGNRVWTLPELLLSPGSDQIPIYTKHSVSGNDEGSVEPDNYISLREFARFWDDHVQVGQLIDHYEGSVILSSLELMTTALQCLRNRHTIQYLDGDLSYSLMGFLRQRPNVNRNDSAFQAFARLSLANDSNLLLERLICLLPEHPTDPWFSLYDHWGASLWDIYPKTQVCGIGRQDTVILDGARAANIRWESFPRLLLRKNDTLKRKIARFLLTLYMPVVLLGLAFIVIGALYSDLSGFLDAGGAVLGLAVCIMFSFPFLINWLYLGKVWSAQPWLIGVEGYMSLPEVERHLFGANLNRLSWSTTGSSLSRHDLLNSEEYEDYCEGHDPSSYPDFKERIDDALHSRATEEKIFTLVDTFTMTVTLFAAVKPPVAVIACGEEGGMQRALLCSWDWTNNTLYRETVLRMETRAYWKMSPVGRIRLALQTRRRAGDGGTTGKANEV